MNKNKTQLQIQLSNQSLLVTVEGCFYPLNKVIEWNVVTSNLIFLRKMTFYSPAKVKSACAFFHVWDRGGPMSLSLVHTQSEDSHSWEGFG